MATQILVGLLMICITAYIHSLVLALAIKFVRPVRTWVHRNPTVLNTATALSITVIWVMLAHLLETMAWATLFVSLDIFQEFEKSFYFSLVAYTTLGFGDVTLPEHWRILSGFIASNGFLVFGWSTAFQVSFFTGLNPYEKKDQNATPY